VPFLGTRGAGSNRAFGYAGAAKPNQVTGLTATDFGTSRAFNNGRIDLSWTAPGNNGATISGYLIERSTNGSSYSTLVANTGTSATTYSDTSLTSSQIYYYKVSAINAAGTGDASTASSATATTVPQAPTIGTATAGVASATVAYTAGATGGKAVSVYTATSSPGSFTGTGASPITVSGLTGGTAYTFTVRATNANGTSAASSASNSATPVVLYTQTFTSNGTWTNPGVSTVEVLVVAGGGGGNRFSQNRGAGGGGGGLVYSASYSVSGNQNVTVGAGGQGYFVPFKSAPYDPTKGSNSTFGALTANGGGIGAGNGGSAPLYNGGSGGGACNNGCNVGGPGSGNQGGAGGTSGGNGSTQALACNMGGGGGGGAGGTGGAGGGSDIRFQNGLWQVQCPDTGNCFSLAGSGGPGASYFGTTYAQGGSGGGANTGAVSLPPANRGIGGSSDSVAQNNETGGSSGVVIVRWYA
jgi:trimeric autotransporter adhesin